MRFEYVIKMQIFYGEMTQGNNVVWLMRQNEIWLMEYNSSACKNRQMFM